MFIFLLMLSAAALASAAGFFSIYGLSQIYAASALSVVIMGVSLEFAKLITASFLYRFWDKIKITLKVYLSIALVILMSITSIGIFGYLTASYQQDNIPVTELSQKLASDKTEIARLTARKSQIDSQIEKLPNKYVNARKTLMNSFEPEYSSLGPKIDALNAEIIDYQTKQVTVEAKIGPIMYVAKVLHQDPNDSIFYLTIIIVIVFDPLAVALTIATNMAMAERKKDKLVVSETPVMPDEIKNPIKLSLEKDYDDSVIEDVVASAPSKRDEILDKIRKEIAESGSA